MITQDELKQLFHYDPETGLFTWITSPARRVKIGDIAGCLTVAGYLSIQIHRKQYLAHRLAWLYIHGKFPVHQIDHINHNRSDNRLCNLRAVTHQQNHFNQSTRKDNSSGYQGVSWQTHTHKYRASIQLNNRKIHLGFHDCPKKAHEAYLKAKAEHHII